jgi:exodeoxyribonuclease-3
VKIISWNVNGIRAAYKKGFLEFVEREDPDVLCVQETKARPESVEPPLLRPAGRCGAWSAASRNGYSGTATFSRQEPGSVARGIGVPEYDGEGRFVVTRHSDLLIYNIYFPNGGSGPERHGFKQKFLVDLREHLRPLVARGEKIAVAGDFNVAHRPIDVFDPGRLAGESGFLPEERAWLDSFLALGFIDTFRHFHPTAAERYTWWSYRERGRVGNRGWRIDYICATENLRARLRHADILDGQQGSDHCPVVAEIAEAE